MARHLFGLSPADFAVERVGDETKLRPGAIGTVWDSYSGGSQLTDLLAIDTTPVSVATATSDATVGFYGPDGVSLVYVDFGYGLRFALVAIDLGPALDTKLALSGGTLTGDLTVSANATVTGLTTLSGALTVALASGFSGLVTASAGLTVSGGTLAAGAVTASSVAATGDTSGATVTGATHRGSAAGSGSNLTLTSTGSATKGKILAGPLTVDEANTRVGVNNTGPGVTLHFIDPSPSTAASFRVDSSGATASGVRALGVRVSTDTQDRLTFDYDGKIQWGPGGSTAPDTSLARTSTGTGLTVTGDLTISGDLIQTAMGVGSTVFVRKTATTTYTSTTTLANDPHLFTPTLPANSVWMCFFAVGYLTSAANTGALKLNMTGPTGWSELLRTNDAVGADTYQFNVGTGDQWGSLAGVTHNASYMGIIRIAGTAGIVRLQAAQWTSSATSTVTQIDSYMYMRRVG